MKTPICKILGIDFPLLAFSHCREVVAAVIPCEEHDLKEHHRHVPPRRTAPDSLDSSHQGAASDQRHAHSVIQVIPVKGDGPVEGGNDGVVEYKSAHIDCVESELVVRSALSTQATPQTIEEIRRILYSAQ